MLDACVACEVRLECLADAVNVVLDMGKIDPKHVASFRAGKGPMQQVAMAREFQHNGLGHVTRDEVAANWRSALPT